MGSLTLYSPSYSETVNVLVGEEKEHFTVHRRLISQNSDLFRTACSKRWRNDEDEGVSLPYEEPCDFQVYLDWVYAQRQQPPSFFIKPRKHADGRYHRRAERLCALWVVGDYVLDRAFKNVVMDELLADPSPRKHLMARDAIVDVIVGTNADCTLRKWLVEHLTVYATPEDLDALREHMDSDLAFTVVRKFAETRNKKSYDIYDHTLRCASYHEHDDDEPVCGTLR